jgi:hypothetical protein
MDEEIIKRLDKIQKSCDRIDNHIVFIETIYTCIMYPVKYLLFIGQKTVENLPTPQNINSLEDMV